MMYVNKLWCHNCHIAIIAVLQRRRLSETTGTHVVIVCVAEEVMLSAPLACLETSCISFSFLFRVKMPRLVLSLPQSPFCAVGKLGRRKCGRGGREVAEGEGWWGAHADSAVATPPLVSLWNDVVISRGSRWWRSEMSPGFSGHGE